MILSLAALVLTAGMSPISDHGHEGHFCLDHPLASYAPQTTQKSQDKGQGQAGDDKKTKEQIKFESEIQDDKKIGKEAADYYDRELKPTKDSASQARVEAMGNDLALIANSNQFEVYWGDKRHAEFEYKFKVVSDVDVNAFSLPGGYIYVYQGLVDFCQSDDELAGVLAHEIMHAEQRHVSWMRKEQQKLAPIQIPLILASIFTGDATGLLAGNLVGTAATSGWSQKAETSADYGGFQLMVAAGYDATGMLTFMERLQMKDGVLEKAVDLGILRTHPPSKMRAEKIEGYMKANSLAVRRSKVTTTFRVQARKTDAGPMAVLFGKRKLFLVGGDKAAERAAMLSKSLNEFLDAVPEMYEVQVGEDGTIYGKNKVLIRFTADDVALNGGSMDALQNETVKLLRASIFQLAYHLWESRG